MKKIVILIPSLKKGGAEKQACLLARALRDSHDVKMIIISPEAGMEEENIQLSTLPLNSIHRLHGSVFLKAKNIYSILHTHRSDILFCYLTKPDILGPIVGKIAGVKYIYQGLRNTRIPKAKMILEKIGNIFSTGAVINNYSGVDYFKQFNINNQIVIPNCFYNIQPERQRQEKKYITVVTVGRFVEQKDYPTAIAAMAEAMSKNPRLRYKIIGHGELECEVRDFVTKHGISDKTEILINPKGIIKHLEDTDIYLATSLFEGTSNSIMEALDASLPVVATNVGDNYRMVKDGITGFLEETGDIQSISNHILTLSASNKMRNEFGIAGNRLLRETYSFDAFKKQYLDLVEMSE